MSTQHMEEKYDVQVILHPKLGRKWFLALEFNCRNLSIAPRNGSWNPLKFDKTPLRNLRFDIHHYARLFIAPELTDFYGTPDTPFDVLLVGQIQPTENAIQKLKAWLMTTHFKSNGWIYRMERARFKRAKDQFTFVTNSPHHMVLPDCDAFLDENITMLDTLIDVMNTIEKRSSSNGEMSGIATGFSDFDKLTGGLKSGELAVFATRIPTERINLFLSMLRNIARSNIVAVFSLEMHRNAILFRLISALSGVDSVRLESGHMIDEEWGCIAKAADQLSHAKAFFHDSRLLTVADIRSRCLRLLSSEKKLDLVVIDFLQLMRSLAINECGTSQERAILEIGYELKNLAKELCIPIVVFSQLKSSNENRSDKLPTLVDIHEMGGIEHTADLICFIHRDEMSAKDKKGVKLIVEKNNSGNTGTIQITS